MGLERGIIKARAAGATTFNYQARELDVEVSDVARNYADRDANRSPDFKISELVAQQAGISQIESDMHRDQINQQVLEKIKEVEERAYAAGHELGLIEGSERAFQETKSELNGRIDILQEMLKKFEQIKLQMLLDNEHAVVRMVFLVAKKLALRDIQQNPEAIWTLLQGIIGEIQADERVEVKLNHEDLLFLETLHERGGQRIEGLKRVTLVADDTVTPGGCVIETDHGTVNATLEERTERLWATLEEPIPKRVEK